MLRGSRKQNEFPGAPFCHPTEYAPSSPSQATRYQVKSFRVKPVRGVCLRHELNQGSVKVVLTPSITYLLFLISIYPNHDSTDTAISLYIPKGFFHANDARDVDRFNDSEHTFLEKLHGTIHYVVQQIWIFLQYVRQIDLHKGNAGGKTAMGISA